MWTRSKCGHLLLITHFIVIYVVINYDVFWASINPMDSAHSLPCGTLEIMLFVRPTRGHNISIVKKKLTHILLLIGIIQYYVLMYAYSVPVLYCTLPYSVHELRTPPYSVHELRTSSYSVHELYDVQFMHSSTPPPTPPKYGPP